MELVLDCTLEGPVREVFRRATGHASRMTKRGYARWLREEQGEAEAD